MGESEKSGETSTAEKPSVAARTWPAASSAPPNLMPVYMVLVCIALGLYQFIDSRMKGLQELEASWDPRPKYMEDSQVTILYCNG